MTSALLHDHILASLVVYVVLLTRWGFLVVSLDIDESSSVALRRLVGAVGLACELKMCPLEPCVPCLLVVMSNRVGGVLLNFIVGTCVK